MPVLSDLFKLFRKPKKVGLVLGGGVARGLAHIGVLKVLDTNSIPVHCIAATSSGALIGSLYAGGMSPFQMEKDALKIGWHKIAGFYFSTRAPFSSKPLMRFIEDRIGKINFNQLKIPLSVVATDLISGKEVILKKGKVSQAVAASSAFPGIFQPIKNNKYDLLADGGMVNNLPTSVIKKMGANFIIAVDVVPGQKMFKAGPKDAVQILGRSIDIMLNRLSKDSQKKADFLIEPKIEENIWHLDLNKSRQLILEGEIAALKLIKQIKKSI